MTQEFPAVIEKTVTKARSYEPKSSGAISPKKLTPMMASAQRGRKRRMKDVAFNSSGPGSD